MCTFSERDCRSPFPEVPVNQRNRCAAANRVRRLLRLTGVSDSFGAGTIIGGQDATPSLSCNSAHGCTHGCTYYRGTRSHWLRDMSPTYRILRAAALPPIGGTTSGIPPLCALVRSGLSTGAVGMLTARCVTSPSESQRCLESLQRRQEPTRCPPSGTIDSSNRADRLPPFRIAITGVREFARRSTGSPRNRATSGIPDFGRSSSSAAALSRYRN